MTDWVNIANSAVAPKAPVTSELITALRDNTVTTMWEEVADIYNAPLDGSVTSFETTDYELGWTYMIRFDKLVANTTASLFVEHYDDTNATYTNNVSLGTTSGGYELVGDYIMTPPRKLLRSHGLYSSHGVLSQVSGSGAVSTLSPRSSIYRSVTPSSTDYTAQKTRFRMQSGSFTGGIAYLYRKREEDNA